MLEETQNMKIKSRTRQEKVSLLYHCSKSNVKTQADLRARVERTRVSPCEGGAYAVVRVDHGGDAVEAEAVEAELLHPPPRVAQQKTQHFP